MTNIDKTIILTGDFNIRDSNWDPNFRHHSSHTDDLITIADSLGPELSSPSNPGPTRFADNPHNTNSVIDLVFLSPNNTGFGRHTLHPKIHKPSNHVPLIIEIGIGEVNTDINIWSIKKDSKKEKEFISSLVQGIQSLDKSAIRSQVNLKASIQQLVNVFENTWNTHSKQKHITKHSNEWWNQDCTDGLNKYHKSGNLKHWKEFKSVVRTVKREFFNNKIHEIASSNKRPWDLMSWVRKKSLPAIESISYENRLCNTLPDLWNALHKSYNSAENRPVNTRLLNELPQADSLEWPPFSSQEFRDAIAKCSSSSTPGPDHILWRHLKAVISHNTCLEKLVHIANACITLEYWPSHFKSANSVVIPKPNKMLHNTPSSFRPIVLLNTTGKLIEKVVSNRLQFHMTANGFLDPNQLGGIRQRSTTDAGVYLTHIIHAG